MIEETGAGWRLIHGDCRDVLPSLERVAHCITDPPYSAHVHGKQWVSKALSARGDKRAASEHAEIGFACLDDAALGPLAAWFATTVARWSLVFCDLESIARWRDAAVGAGLEYVRSCIWDKIDSCPQFTGDRPASSAEAIVCAHPYGRKRWNGGGARNVLRYSVNSGIDRGDKHHPTQKPLELMLELVDLFTDPGETVLDAFAGSGSTGVACIRRGRPFVGIEREEKYFRLACERLRAEEGGQSLKMARSGQATLFGAAR